MKTIKTKLTRIIAATLIAVTMLSFAVPVTAGARWQQQGGRWWYELTATTWATGWKEIGGVWYYFDSAGWMQTGWVHQGGAWYFLRDSGAMATGWINDRGTWYFLSPNGAMVTGWVQDGALWYWMHPSGAMATGAVTIGGERHTFATNGRWLSGGTTSTANNAAAAAAAEGNWQQRDGRWWYELSATTWAIGWRHIGGAWYFFDNDGWMQTGWVHDGGDVYFMRTNGVMVTGWLEIDGNWYYFRPNGTMATGTVSVNNVWRTFTVDGRWLERSSNSPLSGLPIPENMASRRPLAVSLNNNSPAALPMNGVSRADIIYEVAIEYNRTRMIALFQDTSNLPTIGSIRSARYYIGEIADSHDAILLSFGRSFLANEIIPSRNTTWINAHEGPAAHRQIINRNPYRIPGRTVLTEHNVVTSGELINRHLPNYGFRLNHNAGWNNRLSFVDNATPAGGAVTNNVNIRFTTAKSSAFTFDAARGVYHMRQTINGTNSDFVDANNGARVEFTNLIILRTDVGAHPRDGAPPVETNRLREVRTTGTGTGYFVNGGRRVAITWSRENYSAPFVYRLASNNQPLNLGRGTTYVAIVPIAAPGGVTW
ncbi:MAG: DUF3048 domain-containing protein [Oscillospiraceae bacterium]|nr:DUF3048 domain-containing protein [Oscillospiraceae bacterium]